MFQNMNIYYKHIKDEKWFTSLMCYVYRFLIPYFMQLATHIHSEISYTIVKYPDIKFAPVTK